MQKRVIHWLIKAKRRKTIITHLKQPMTAKQLAQTSGLREDCCSYVLKELSAYQLVSCLNPQVRRSRLYWLTSSGMQSRKKVLRNQGLSVDDYDFPVVDWSLYGWICYNHRSAVIKVITEPIQPSSIRRKVKQQNSNMKISTNNVSDILRLFLKKKIVRSVEVRRKIRCRYELTELGKKLQILLCRTTTTA